MPWLPLPGIAFAIAIHPFKPSVAADLPLELGDELYIIEEGGQNRSWFRGYLVAPPSLLAGLTSAKGQKLEARVFSGIFPKNCVHIREYLGAGAGILGEQSYKTTYSKPMNNASASRRILKEHGVVKPESAVETEIHNHNSVRPPAPVPMLRFGDETPTMESEPLVDEIAYCLREWHSTNLHELLLSRDYRAIDKLSKLVSLLDVSRRQLLHGVLTKAELATLRERIIWDLVNCNKMLGNDVVVRDPKQKGRLLTANDNAVEVAKLQSTMSLLEKPLALIPENSDRHHLLIEIEDFISSGDIENILLTANLCVRKDAGPLSPLTESFTVALPSRHEMIEQTSSNKFRTLFSNLTPAEAGVVPRSNISVFLVVKVLGNDALQDHAKSPVRSSTVRDAASKSSRDVSSPTSFNGPKSGRRSMMWGNSKSQRERMQSDGRSDSPTDQSLIKSSTPPSTPKTQATEHKHIKKVIGAAVVSLGSLSITDDPVEKDIPVWSLCSGNDNHTSEDAEIWDDAIKHILVSPESALVRLRTLSSIKFRFTSFIHPEADTLIKMTPTILHEILETPKMSFSGAPTKPRSDIYITLREPRLPEGAVFSHPERGFLQLNKSLDMCHLQLTLEIRRNSGERIEKCIFPSSDSKGLTAWRSVAVRRGQCWDETIRLAIPDEDVPKSHVIMSIADAPGFPFALCWIPLWSGGAFLPDGDHTPLLHIYDKITSSTLNGKGAYLDLPWDPRGKESLKFESIAGPMATLNMNSYLCSTVFSQDKTLLGVLRWKEQADSNLVILLRQLTFVPEIEIVKHVNDLFDALFGIVVDRSGTDEIEDLMFMALVTILGIVYDRRFKLGPLVHDYAQNRFNYPFATPCLLRSYLRLIQRPADYQSSRHLRAAFKVGQQIMTFIAVARRQLMAKEVSIGVTNTQAIFNRDIKEIFNALESQMRDTSALAIGSKTLLVQHIYTWLPELELCFGSKQVMDLTISFIDACSGVQGKLILHKLVLILNVVKDRKDADCDALRCLQAKLQKWIEPYWGETIEVSEQYREQVRLCCSILSYLEGNYGSACMTYYIKILQSYHCIRGSPKLRSNTASLLFQTCYPFVNKQVQTADGYDEILTELATLKATVSATDFVKFADASRSDLIEMLTLTLDVDMSIINGEAFPKSWLTLNVFSHRIIFDMLDGCSKIFLRHFLPSPDDADSFDTELWRKFLLSILQLVRSDTLALENFADQKRRAVWKIGGDVREKGAALLAQVWDALGWEIDSDEKERYGVSRIGGFQVQYVPGFVAPIVELCLSVHEGLRSVAVVILQSMIISEWTLNENLSVVQTEIVVCLDGIFRSRGFGTDTTHRTFIEELKDTFRHLKDSPDEELWQATQDLFTALDEMLRLLIAAHAPEQEESHRIMNTLHLMEFLRGMQKEDMYVSYVHQLASAEAQVGNHKEAGLALRLHADIYSWDPDDSLDKLVDPSFPKQSSFERKEGLYFRMIQHFEEAGAWEPALAAYRELAEQYERTSFDFSKLARTVRSTAKIYEMISRGEVNTPRYYRVVYSGLGFPLALRDNTFIFEGSASERLNNFTEKLLKQHPAAQLVTAGDADVIEGQYLQVTPVAVHRNLSDPLYQRQKVSHSTKEFLSLARTQHFSVTTRRHTPKSGVKDQWVEKTIFTTVDVFPTILKRSKVVHEETVSLSPLETALERTLRKSYELVILDRRVASGDDSSTFALMEALRSSINPSSTSSIALYRKMLSFTNEGPEGRGFTEPMQPLEIALQTALIDFASTLKHSLNTVEKVIEANEYEGLRRQFTSTFGPELRILTPNVQPTGGTTKVSTPIDRPLSLDERHQVTNGLVDGTNSNHTDHKTDESSAPQNLPQDIISAHMTPSNTSNSKYSTLTLSELSHETAHVSSADPKNLESIVTKKQSFHDHGTQKPRTNNSDDVNLIKELTRPEIAGFSKDYRPVTAQSVVTNKSSRSSKKVGSIRKRLSTLAIGSGGKKPGRKLKPGQPSVEEE